MSDADVKADLHNQLCGLERGVNSNFDMLLRLHVCPKASL